MRLKCVVIVLLAMASVGCKDDRHDERMRAVGPRPSLDALMKVASAESGEAMFRQCMACHTIIEGALDKEGPNLFDVFNKPFGQNRPNYPYTAALIGTHGRWDVPTLNAWLTHPQALVPGTKMQFPGVNDPLDRADVIAFLRSQSSDRTSAGANR